MGNSKTKKRNILVEAIDEMGTGDKILLGLSIGLLIGTVVAAPSAFRVGKINGACKFVRWIANNAPEADAVLVKMNPDMLKIVGIR